MAGKLLAPFIGSSLATWTAVIGMFLAGISFGNWVGGRIADEAPTVRSLRRTLLASGVCVLGLLGLIKLAGDGAVFRFIPLQLRIAVLSFVVCFPPAFLLSLTTPVAIKLLLPDVHKTGRVAGTVYAVGTLGSLIGNFVTGYWLFAHFGVTAIEITTGVALLVLALIIHSGARSASKGADQSTLACAAALDNPNPELTVASACVIVCFCSFTSMALELAASRLLAPTVGVSLYTWTGIIGVVLAGIVTGNYFGGRIADRSPKLPTLASTLFWAGVLTLAILLFFALFNSFDIAAPSKPVQWPGWQVFKGEYWTKVKDWSFQYLSVLPIKILVMSLIMFFAPMVAFGMISPQATRLAISDLKHAGRVAGRVYAWSCAGAIAGTFATGWILIGHFGVLRLVLALAMALILASVVIGKLWRQTSEIIGCVVVFAVAVYAVAMGKDQFLRFDPHALYERETNYYLVRVLEKELDGDDPDKTFREFCLDHLIHSKAEGTYTHTGNKRSWQANAGYLGYGHEQVQSEFARAAAGVNAEPKILVIGGGGYTFPRWVDQFMPKASMEVVEIDPGVTEAAHAALDLPRNTRIRTHNLDGRQFVQEFAPRGQYQLVVQDAVNDLSVPAHIMTREYNQAVRKLLTDDGVYLLTVIDRFGVSPHQPKGRLLPSAVQTMRAAFPHVYVMAEDVLWKDDHQRVFVIAGMTHPFDEKRFRELLKQQSVDDPTTTIMPATELDAYLAVTNPVLLTDDFAPTDNLLAETYLRR